MDDEFGKQLQAVGGASRIFNFAVIDHLDRAQRYERWGGRFESFWSHHIKTHYDEVRQRGLEHKADAS